MEKKMGQQFNAFTDQQAENIKKEKGKVTIKKSDNNSNRTSSSDDGEYVDFEEVE